MDVPDSSAVHLPLETPWTWYAHIDVRSSNYDDATVVLGTFSSFEDFFRHRHHIPPPSQVFTGERVLRLTAQDANVSGYALFRANVTPAWEHPRNATGCDVCARGCWNANDLRMWESLCIDLLNETLPSNVNGVRLTHKIDRRTGSLLHKLEVWLEDTDATATQALVQERAPAGSFVNVILHSTTLMANAHPKPKRGRRGRAEAEKRDAFFDVS